MKSTVLVGLLALVFTPWAAAQPILESGFEAFPDVVLTKIAPVATNASVITYTIEYDYPAESIVPAENVVLTDAIPQVRRMSTSLPPAGACTRTAR